MRREESLRAGGGDRAIRIGFRAQELEAPRGRPAPPRVLGKRLREHAGRHVADVVALTLALGAPAQRRRVRRVLVGAEPIVRAVPGGGGGQEQGERRSRPPGCALEAGCAVHAERSRSKYQASRAESTCEAGMATVAGRKKASG